MAKPGENKRRTYLRVAEVARQRGIYSITELQLLTRVSYSTLHALWEDTLSVDPRMSTLEVIADKLGVRISDLIADEPSPSEALTEGEDQNTVDLR